MNTPRTLRHTLTAAFLFFGFAIYTAASPAVSHAQAPDVSAALKATSGGVFATLFPNFRATPRASVEGSTTTEQIATDPSDTANNALADAADGTPSASSSSSEPTVDEIVARIQTTYDELEDFRADIRQTFTNATLGEDRRSEGRVFFKKPGMMRWDYSTPTERYLISDGRRLWVYEPEFAQYYTQSLAESQLPTALRFMMGEGTLDEDFDITIESRRSGGEVVLELRPKRSEGQLRALHFVVDTASWQVVETTVFDPLGNVNRIRFSNIRQNSGLPSSGFQFTPPEGASQVRGPSGD